MPMGMAFVLSEGTPHDDYVHVIEYSAFKKVKEEKDEWMNKYLATHLLDEQRSEPEWWTRLQEIKRQSDEWQNAYFDMKLKAELLERALEKIANFNTLDGDKYNSYEQGWHGVAEFAREALAEYRGDKLK